tara:strand:- start:34 stop:1608 length:1575 start_codon:yes stop_codon:yes gene_type:complete
MASQKAVSPVSPKDEFPSYIKTQTILTHFKKYHNYHLFMDEEDFDNYYQNTDSIDFEERISNGVEYEYGFIHFLIYTKYNIDFSNIVDEINVNLLGDGFTALHYALRYSNTESSHYYVRMLLNSKNIDVNRYYSDFDTPLTYALSDIETVYPESIKALINHKDINVNLYSDCCYPPIYYIMKGIGNEKYEDIYKLLLQHPEMNFEVEDEENIPFDMLLSRDVSEEKINEYASIIMNHPKFCADGYEFITGCGCNESKVYVSYLCRAIRYNNEFVIDRLLEEDANINGHDTCYISPLNTAISNCNFDLVFRLIEKGKQISEKLSQYHYLEFIDNEINGVEIGEESSIELIFDMENTAIAHQLINIFFNSETFHYNYSFSNDDNLFTKYIMSDKATIDGIDCFFSHSSFMIDSNMYRNSISLLMKYFSSMYFSIDIFKKILNHRDVYVDHCDGNGNNLLMYYLDLVKSNVNPEIVSLISKKDDFYFDHKNKEGQTALSMVKQYPENENTKIVIKLLEDIESDECSI